MESARIPRRRLLAGMAGLVAVTGLTAACGPGPASPGSGTSQSQGTSVGSKRPERGGTLILGQTAAVQTTNPQPSNNASTNLRTALFNTLVTVDDRLKPAPELAESWTLSDDGLTLTLKLREGVKFHNGKEFTADEAKWNVEYAGDPKSLSQTVSQLQGVQTTVKDKYTVDLKLPQLLPQIFSLLAGAPVVDPASDLNKSVVGTGPFRIDSFTPGDQLRMARFDGYWRQGYPLLDSYVIKVVPDVSGLLVNLRSGAVHVAIDPPLNEVGRLASGATKIESRPGAGNYEIIISAVDRPFDDKRVRQAMSFALDRKRVVDAVLFGQSEPTFIAYPKSSPVWDASLDTGEFSLDRARELLGVAGLSNGFATSIVTSTSSRVQFPQIAQIFQADLAKIGVTVTIQDLESNEWATVIRNGKFPGLVTHSYGYGDQDPALLFISRPFDLEANSSRFKSAEFRRLVEAGQTERDTDKRIGIYRNLARFLKDEAFVLPIANSRTIVALRSNVQGFRWGYAGQTRFDETWLG